MSFRDEFIKMPASAAREQLIYEAAIKQGPPKNLVPITVNGPSNTKITYFTTPDYYTIDGLRITPSPETAQRIANHFGMSLPTAKQSKQIYNAADTKVRYSPLSAGGYTSPITGKHYTASDVMSHRIDAADAAVFYNEKTNEEIAKTNPNAILIAGHGKDIIEPMGDPQNPSMGGWQGANGKALQPYTENHKGEAERHSEYALYTRLIGNEVIVTTPDGKQIKTTMDKLRANPNLAKSVADSPIQKKYNTPEVKSEAKPEIKSENTKPVSMDQSSPTSSEQPKSGRYQILQRINDYLSSLMRNF